MSAGDQPLCSGDEVVECDLALSALGSLVPVDAKLCSTANVW
jgi:hypothetical protein